MAQITSREELREWLEDKPADWAQVIAARTALRVLPYAYAEQIPQKWVKNYALALVRAMFMSWGSRNFSSYDMAKAAFAAATSRIFLAGAVDAPLAVPVNYWASIPDSPFRRPVAFAAYAVADAATSAADAAFADAASAVAVRAATASADAYAASVVATFPTQVVRRTIWENINSDSDWLEAQKHPALASSVLTHQKLWLKGQPAGWSDTLAFANHRLSMLANDGFSEHYQVWIDWYNRRVQGEDAAFDIPGDVDRTHDKAILARLAEATDANFWGKGATYVNATLQSWIDEARIEARIEEILRKLRGGASAHYGAPEELAGRAALLHELDRLLGRSPQARHGIGGNYPPEPIDASEQALGLPEEMRTPLDAISTELEKREPDALIVVEQVGILHRVGRKLEKMASLASDEFAKSVGGELGKRVVQAAFWLTLINQILDWLAPLIRIAG